MLLIILLISSRHFPRFCVATRYLYFGYSHHFVFFFDSCWCLFDILIHAATHYLNIFGFVCLQIISSWYTLLHSSWTLLALCVCKQLAFLLLSLPFLYFQEFWCCCLVRLLNNRTFMWTLFSFITAQWSFEQGIVLTFCLLASDWIEHMVGCLWGLRFYAHIY